MRITGSIRGARVRAVALREWRETVHNRQFAAVSLIAPAFMLAVTMLPGFLVRRRAGFELPPADELLANHYIAGALLVVFLFLGISSQSQALLRSVLEERGNRMIEVLLASIDPLELLVGKILGYAAVAMTQLGIWLLASVILTRMAGLPSAMRLFFAAGTRTAALFAACYLVGYLLYASLYAIVGAVIGGEREANLYQQLLALLLVSPFVITMSLASQPDDPMVAALTWVPFLAPTLLLLRSSFGPLSAVEVVGTLSLATVTACAGLVLAAKLFKGTTLLSARRVSWREAWRGR